MPAKNDMERFHPNVDEVPLPTPSVRLRHVQSMTWHAINSVHEYSSFMTLAEVEALIRQDQE